MTGTYLLSTFLACLFFGLASAPAREIKPVPPPAQAPLPPPASAAPQSLSHEDMVKEQERRDREAEEERDRDDL
jgi:hypothetical protein